MRVFQTQMPIVGFIILWLSLLTDFGEAADSQLNLWSHTYERIWLWNAYQMALHYEKDQKLILPMTSGKGKTSRPGTNNQHLNDDGTRSGPLDYDEFMYRLKDNYLLDKPPALTAPTSMDDLAEASKSLFKNGHGGLISLVAASPGNYNSKESDKAYQTFIASVNNKVVEWRGKHKTDFEGTGRFATQDKMMKGCAKAVVALRKADGQEYLIRVMGGSRTAQGELGLNEPDPNDNTKTVSTVTTTSVECEVPGPDKNYKAVDFEATWNDARNREKLQAKFGGDINAMVKWGDNIGNPKTAAEDSWTKQHISHFKTLQVWKRAKSGKVCSL